MKDSQGTIVFAHANSFPAGVYRMLFESWRQAGFTVLAPEQFGHDPAFPVQSNWRSTRDELLHFIDQHRPAGPLHLVGHSLGGYVCLLAACRRPELARSLVLLDSPLVRGWRARSVQLLKLTGLMQRLGPGHVAISRRQHWDSAEQALAHFRAKRKFARWHPEVLSDYMASGLDAARPQQTLQQHGGVSLRFRPEVETRIYNTLPHHLDALLRRHPPRCTVSYIGGTRSSEGRRLGMNGTRMLVGDRVQWIDGSHLFPMEQPEATAQAVLRAIRSSAM